MEKMEKQFKALGDRTRLKILSILSFRPCCVCEITDILGLSQPTVTRHLQKLTEAGFLEVRRHSFYQIYRLHPKDRFCRGLLHLVIEKLKQGKEYERLMKKLKEVEKLPFSVLESMFPEGWGYEEVC
ncbi:MAG: winged helix-turn-helix transcriptional regulator [Deferribacteres bacterium]|nr:winged helix-turn-helix transcriptional regulator [Deferribacteres bacterium]